MQNYNKKPKITGKPDDDFTRDIRLNIAGEYKLNGNQLTRGDLKILILPRKKETLGKSKHYLLAFPDPKEAKKTQYISSIYKLSDDCYSLDYKKRDYTLSLDHKKGLAYIETDTKGGHRKGEQKSDEFLKDALPDEARIDSLKIRIPIDKVRFKNQKITSKRVVVLEATGEIEETLKARGHKQYDCDGEVKTYYGIEKQVTANQSTQEYLVMLINSHILNENYFDAICKETLIQVYNKIIEHGLFHISYDDFIMGECTDVDFKKDRHDRYIEKSIQAMKECARPSALSSRGYNTYRGQTGRAIAFSDRRKSSPSNPYVKYYEKLPQLKEKKPLFLATYLSENDQRDLKHLARIEVTVKNKKHFRTLGIKDTSLKGLVSLSKEERNQIVTELLKKQLMKQLKTINTPTAISSNDIFRVNSMNLAIQLNIPIETAIESMLRGTERSYKSRNRKTLMELYNAHIKGSEQANDSEHIGGLFNFFGFENEMDKNIRIENESGQSKAA